VTAPRPAVRVTIGGEEYAVRSELPEEYTREVALYVDTALRHIRESLPNVESHKAAILTALSITDELFQARAGDRDLAARLQALTATLLPLLPPGKRGGRGTPTPATD
jgi:cell division protein ZapA